MSLDMLPSDHRLLIGKTPGNSPISQVIFPPHRVVDLLPSDGLVPSVTRAALEAWEANRG